MSEAHPGITVARLVDAAGDTVASVAGDPDTLVCGIAILDPDDEPASYPEQLVLLVGARGRDASSQLRAAAGRGASAVAAKPGRDGTAELADLAAAAGVALLTVAPQVRWDHLEALVREILDDATLPRDGDGDLFELAETTAVLTGGIVSIEDAGNRVLAYSRSTDEVDELRRLSILGWQGPEQYMALLRDWGVFRRLRASEAVVPVEEHPELGIRRRLAIGIKAGARHLGVIWVQEGGRPLADTAESALVGAARIAAAHLSRHRGPPAARDRERFVADLLEGTANADLLAGRLGLDPARPVLVLAFAVREATDGEPVHEATRAQVGNVIAVQATSYRHGALAATVATRTYAVLPDPPADPADPSLVAMAREIAQATRNRTGAGIQVGIGATAPRLADVATSRREADRTLDAMARTPERTVASIADLRTQVLLGETLELLATQPQLRVPAVQALLDHDAAQHTDLAVSLLAYLDALGDVRSAAGSLHVHPNTLRHRLRRAAGITGTALDDPAERLLCHLHLVLALRGPGS